MKTEIGSSSETSSLWFCDSVLYTYIVILETEIGGSSRVIYWFSMTQYHIIHIVIMETEIGSSRVTYWFFVTQYHIISYTCLPYGDRGRLVACSKVTLVL